MKNLFLILFTLFLTATSWSQEINTSIKNLSDLESKTTYYIKTGDTKLDAYYEETLNKYWSFTKLEFITSDDLAQFEEVETNYYLSVKEADFSNTEVQYRRPTKVKEEALHSENQLLLFNQLKVKKKSFSLENLIAETTMENTKLSNVIFGVQLMNSQLKFAINLDTKSDWKLKDLLKQLSDDNKYLLKSKTLHLLEDNLDSEINSEEEFGEYYPYSYKFSTQSEIDKAIINQDESIVYIDILNYAGVNYVTFYTTKDAQIIFSFIMRGANQTEIRKHFFKKALRD